MNPTFDYNTTQRDAERACSHQAVQKLAANDARAAVPGANQPYAGEVAITNSFKPLLGVHRYWAWSTFVSMVATLLLATLSLGLAYFLEPSLALTASVAFTMAATVISGYHWIFKRWGPAKITEERLLQAKAELLASGDTHKPSVSLLEMLVLVGVMTIDGFLSGSSLVDSVFSHLFTPRGAMIAAVAWGVGSTVLLCKLILDAATEETINERRGIIRQLRVSDDAEDQALATAMKKAVGGKLGDDLSTKANRYGARSALVVCVIVLAGSTFLLRTNAPVDADAVNKTAPVIVQPTMIHV